MALFVLEIGSEELPARFLAGEEEELRDRLTRAMDDAGIVHGGVRTMSTPRRAVALVDDVQALQEEREEVVTGPPVRAAYDPQGAPTKALEGFAKTHGVSVAEVFTEQTPKGEYIAVRKRSGGARAADLLAGLCPQVITSLPFAKRMRWGAHSLAYARPLRWIVALLDAEVIPFSVGPVASGRVTWGHRIHGRQQAGPHAGSVCIEVPSAGEWLDIVRGKGGVEPDSAARRATIIKGGDAQARAVGGTVLWKEGLLDEVQGLCEHPVPLMGSFDPSYLEVPREVLLTSMESHQKSFGVEDAQGRLLPHFLTVLNLEPQDLDLVRRGWERVLRARLEDARFFWRSDLDARLDDWLEKLDAVIFIGKLGTMGDKTRRLERLCAWLAERCGVDPALAARAGRLSKADLVSGMVGEFDTLQGVMGGIYAARKGEPAAVAAALGEQYLPAGPDTPLPKTLPGALLSMADKADTLAGCFGLGMIPSGTADPNGLRRCALGIARIIEGFGLRLDVAELFREAQGLYGDIAWKLPPDDALAKLVEFFSGRLKSYLLLGGGDTLIADAALNVDCTDVWAATARFAVIQKMQAAATFGEAAQTFKRVTNILRKQGGDGLDGVIRPELLPEAGDKAFAAALGQLLPRLDALWEKDDFDGMAQELLALSPAVSAFFDGVMVMCDDPALRTNRLNMLEALARRMNRLADFAALQV